MLKRSQEADAILVIIVAVLIRWAVSLYPYSGAGIPPMHGDYEAQRHWMEITNNVPIQQWYVNTTDNDLQYWGLDYPPLTAYHSWLCAYVADKIDPSWVALNTSKGYESSQHKLFMRYTVLVIDLFLYIPAILAFYSWTLTHRTNGEKLICVAVALVYPGIILIDHGHFQYNNASLGFALWAIVALATGHNILGSIAFVLALNYKQMELYHAMPFFCYLLGNCLFAKDENRFFKLLKIGVAVIITFALCWLPFLTDKDVLLQVVQRLFPFGRGLFEDKVSNVWCSIEVLFKIRRFLSQQSLVHLSLATTLVCLLPSSVNLLLNPTIEKFKISLVNSSLVFFLFSYQVHEKSILIVALPVCLLLHQYSYSCMWFLLISTFSMLPLLIKDGLIVPYVALCILFYVAVCISQNQWFNSKPNKTPHIGIQLLFWTSMLGASILTTASALVKPPARYPDLFPVLISLYSCGHFVLFLVWFHYLQFTTSVVKTTRDSPHSKKADSNISGRKGKGKRKTHKVE